VIITESKPWEEVVQMLEGLDSIFIVGCGECATECQTGGEYEVEQMTNKLQEVGKTVTGNVVPDATCIVLDVARLLRQQKEEVAQAQAILVLACGAGVQAVAEKSNKIVLPGLNSLFLGDTVRHGQMYEWCSMCGACILDKYAGICPITRCPKGQLNGPCGGADEGMCEVDPERECVWALIYERLAKLGMDDERIAATLEEPKDYQVQVQPRERIFEPRRTQ